MKKTRALFIVVWLLAVELLGTGRPLLPCLMAAAGTVMEVQAADTATDGEQTSSRDAEQNVVRVEVRLQAYVSGKETEVLAQRSGSGFFVKLQNGGVLAVTALDAGFDEDEIAGYTEQLRSGEQKKADEDARAQAQERGEENAATLTADPVSVEVRETFTVHFGGDLVEAAEEIGPESRERRIRVLSVPSLSGSNMGLPLAADAEQQMESVSVYGFSSKTTGTYAASDTTRVRVKVAETSEAVQANDGGRESFTFRIMIPDEVRSTLADEALVGGPVISENGAVLGVFVGVTGDSYYGEAVSAKSVRELLSLQGRTAEEREEEVSETSEEGRPRVVQILAVAASFMVLLTLFKYMQDLVRALADKHRMRVPGRSKTSAVVYARMLYVRTNEILYIDKDKYVIGSRPDLCDFAVPGYDTVDGRHFCLLAEGRGCKIVDLNTREGTKVNGRKIRPNVKVPMKKNMEIQAGTERFVFLGR